MSYVHSPVLLEEILSHFVGEQDEWFLDCTVGEGGHTEAILDRFQGIKVIGLDRDESILKIARQRLERFGERFVGIDTNFIDLSLIKDKLFDSALIDLGVSVYHYKKSKKGFSFSEKEKLDMRLDKNATRVFDIVNNYGFTELSEIFFKYGEERFARIISQKIIDARSKKKIEYSDELAEIIRNAIPSKFRNTRIHSATKCFQALRIAANNELENIDKGIPEVLSVLKTNGKLGIITFHSIEDRIVKQKFIYLEKDCICPPKFPQCICGKKKEINIIGKPIMPNDEEIRNNPPSRSAKLRIVEKLG